MRLATRYEIKYRILPEHAERLRAWLVRYMDADQNGEGGEACYDVHSLYLDSRDWSIYQDTRNGAFARFKVRARCYKFDADAPLFLEVKARAGEAMTKSRALVPRAEGLRILDHAIPSVPETTALDNFRNHMDLRRAFPRVWVTYRRYAYVGGERGLVRVTFDDQIRCAPPTPDLSEPKRWYPLPEIAGRVVLELKYNGSYPAWVAEMIRTFDLERNSMSKYRQGVEVLRAIPGMESRLFPHAGAE